MRTEAGSRTGERWKYSKCDWLRIDEAEMESDWLRLMAPDSKSRKEDLARLVLLKILGVCICTLGVRYNATNSSSEKMSSVANRCDFC